MSKPIPEPKHADFDPCAKPRYRGKQRRPWMSDEEWRAAELGLAADEIAGKPRQKFRSKVRRR